MRNYTRWTRNEAGSITADILGSRFDISVATTDGKVSLNGDWLSPDEARMIGVRLIEAAALADGDRAIRSPRP